MDGSTTVEGSKFTVESEWENYIPNAYYISDSGMSTYSMSLSLPSNVWDKFVLLRDKARGFQIFEQSHAKELRNNNLEIESWKFVISDQMSFQEQL